jgi:hypothetical protein
MVTWQLAFTANVATQLFTWLKSDELAGVTDEITSGVLPVFVIVTEVCAGVFRFRFPNAAGFGEIVGAVSVGVMVSEAGALSP